MWGILRRSLACAAVTFVACSVPDYGFEGGGEDAGSEAGGSAGSGGSTTGGSGGSGGDASPDSSGGSGGDAGAGGCSSNSDCVGATPVCDTSTSTCVECLPSNDVCPVGTYCSGTACVVGCNDVGDCVPQGSGPPDGGALGDAAAADAGSVTLACDTSKNLCVGCVYDWNCPVGTICDGSTSTCIPGCLEASTCPSGFDCCDNDCVNPQTSTDHCGACGAACAPTGGTGKCDNGVCTVDTCDPGLGDCNSSGTDGCESTLSADPANCGVCGNPCPPLPNAAAGCNNGLCGLGTCNPGYQDCNTLPSDGCEANLSADSTNCGSCGFACALLNASSVCQAGVCTIASCTAGYANCDSDTSTGCETNTQTDEKNCGICGKACSFANAAAACNAGQCTIGTCAAPYANCDTSATNGCEANLNTDPTNCGICGKVCNSTNGTASCTAGVCDITCKAGYADCDNNPANGCEVNLASVTNCGSCGNICSSNNGTPSCTTGTCAISCNAGFGNCDGAVSNGCETNTNTSVNHCSACGLKCPTPGGATPNCVSGVCGISSCTDPYADCNGQSGDGCEVNTATSASNCGACGTVCSVANGTAACNNKVCAVGSCNAGFANCDGLYANGCEKNLKSDLSNCGACGSVCSIANGAGVCSNGTCAVASCNTGYANCDGLASNGCETNLNTTANCGACGVSCTNGHGTTQCSSGVCNPTCASGWSNCNGNPNDGCETSTTTLTNCGSCGSACDLQNASESCSTGSCQVTTCSAGWGNCDGTHPNGCETNTTSSVTNCGSCGSACSSANGIASCSGGNCGIVCNTGWGNCNNNAGGDGCETNTTSNASHCGTCGNACTSGQVCTNSSCNVVGCPSGYQNCSGSGCTCEGTGCCGTGCQIKHNNGLGQNWFDCTAYGTYNQVQAGKACQAWVQATGSTASCATNCGGKSMCAYAGGGKPGACWGYLDTVTGHVYQGTGQFICPVETDPWWDPP